METNQNRTPDRLEPVVKCDQLTTPIENRILTFRGKPIMIDRDLAELYGVETKRLNEQVKRNIERFPDSFRFRLTDEEKDELVANCDRFNGQIFDAYALIADLIRQANTRIVVIDNYIDDSVLVQLSKRKAGVTVDIYDGQISRQLRQDVEKHNEQYPSVTLHKYTKAHDRFLIIDEDVYHIGASLKDLGKKLFAFSKMEVMTGTELLTGL